MMRRTILALLSLQLLAFGTLGAQSYMLVAETAALEEAVVLSKLASAREIAPECLEAVWPDIPASCLERVPPRGAELSLLAR